MRSSVLTKTLAGALGLLVAAVAPGAFAQTIGIDAVAVHPSAGQGDLIQTVTTRTGDPLTLSVGLGAHYTDSPLTMQGTDELGRTFVEQTLQNRAMAELLLGFTVIDALQLSLAAPVALIGAGNTKDAAVTAYGDEDVAGFHIGEPRFGMMGRLFGAESFALGVSAHATLPGGEAAALAASGLGFGGGLVVDVSAGPLLLSLNAGAHIRTEPVDIGVVGKGPSISAGNELRSSLGVEIEVAQGLALLGETYLRTPLDAPLDEGGTLLEPMAGVRWRPLESLSVSASGGGGTPLFVGWGTARFRAMLDVRWTFRASPDSDGDGISDGDDQCPVLPEDVDTFEDEDGCPDPDNDQDTFMDVEDQCPHRAEDVDGFEDEDGCPEDDNDGDGRLDAEDSCPLEAEDYDGYADDDGCPELDNDADGIPDAVDRCPDVPELVNDFEDEDGCPDYPGVVVVEDRIVLKERVDFDPKTHEPLVAADPILRTVARFLNAHTEYARVRLDIHTDQRRNRGEAQAATQARGEALMRYLIIEGVAPGRLEIRAVGDKEPIADQKSAEGRHANNRVELFILK